MGTGGTGGLGPQERLRWVRIGALGAVAMLLGYLETFLPIPIPGVKLGLANIAVLVLLARGDAAGACWVALIKVLASGLLFGSPITMAYSAVGTLLSLLVMVPLSRLRTMRPWMTSTVGALAHEAGQLLVAQTLLGTPLVWYGAPPLLVAGCATGVLCGMVAQRAARLLDEGAQDAADPMMQDATEDAGKIPATGTPRGKAHVDPRVALVVLITFALFTLHLHALAPLAVALAVAAAACAWAQVTSREVLAALAPTAFICGVTFVAQVLTLHDGTAAFQVVGLVVTYDALRATGMAALRLVALVCASVAYTHLQGADQMTGALRWFLAPLESFGLRLEGPLLALDVALGILPLLAGESGNLRSQLRGAGGISVTLDALPRLVVHVYRMGERLALSSNATTGQRNE